MGQFYEVVPGFWSNTPMIPRELAALLEGERARRRVRRNGDHGPDGRMDALLETVDQGEETDVERDE